MAIPTPLTTVFTPPSECLSTIFWSSGGQYQLGYSTECIPSGPAPSLSSYFSPGLYCPESYTVACTDLVILGATSTETQAVCCPRLDGIASGRFADASFRCNTDRAMPWYSSLGCTMNFGTAATEGPITVLYTRSSTTYTTTYSAATTDGLNAYSVKIAWRASDLTQSSTGSATASESSIGSASNLPDATADSASVTSSSATSGSSTTPPSGAAGSAADGGLSTSAKIAIGITIPVAIIALIIVGLLVIRRKKRAAHMTDPGVEISSNPVYEKDTTFTSDLGSEQTSEVDSRMVGGLQELPGHVWR
ncbi:hypothetical protein BKA67DRAFT_382755 [Truncatella angustata]|uniref:Uncharacterized protein n=1 Tax=Truncatella angustata TaxID=152316 RepID=A0A9P8UFP7_9PEZI|nr:uncharacterized protein BKA67DRAFT_382755 [Truncatella angustata]KAH6649168.1 hypothetical protein BKA67DRAFT_382755 [Truncatella angustata]